jgi:hypothetical protein
MLIDQHPSGDGRQAVVNRTSGQALVHQPNRPYGIDLGWNGIA